MESSIFLMEERATGKPVYHFVTAVWGESFTRLYQRLTIPTQLSAGNLPAMPRDRSVYKIYTDKATRAKLADSAELRAVERCVQVQFELVDDHFDLKQTPAHTAMNWCHNQAIAAGLKAGAHVIFLSPDAVWSDGSFERLVHWAEAGKKAVIHIAFRVAMRPFLHDVWKNYPADDDLSLTLPPRELAHLTLKHLHPFLHKNFYDSKDFSPLPSHIYWKAGNNELLARGFHLHPLMVKPTTAADQSDVTIDFDYAVRTCREDEIHIVTDSDEILALDVTDTKRFANVVPAQSRNNFAGVIGFAAHSTNQHCRKLINAKYRLHSGPLTPDWQHVELRSDRVVRALRCAFPFLPLVRTYGRVKGRTRRKAVRAVQIGTAAYKDAATKASWFFNAVYRRTRRVAGRVYRSIFPRPTVAPPIESSVPTERSVAAGIAVHAPHTSAEMLRNRWSSRFENWNETRQAIQAGALEGLKTAHARGKGIGSRVVRFVARGGQSDRPRTPDSDGSSQRPTTASTTPADIRRVAPTRILSKQFRDTPSTALAGATSTAGNAMYVLGLSFDYHDASATLAVDGRVIAAADEERFSRKKHDPRFPRQAVEFCLERAGITADQLEAVVFYEQPLLKFERILTAVVGAGPAGEEYLDRTLEHWARHGKFDARARISEHLQVKPKKIHCVDHHESHAAAAFYCSPFQAATIVTLDGTGEFETCTVSVGRGTKIEKLYSVELPHSLGLLYSAFTAFLGFEVNEGEYKVMGMAGFGRPRLTELIRPLIRLLPDGRFEIAQECFEFLCPGRLPYNQKLLDLLGPSRVPECGFELGDLDQPPANDLQRESRYYADIAASLQACVEEAISHVVEHAVRRTGEADVCLAGGVALNSSANGKLQRQLAGRLYVHPAAGDSGGSLGAALHYSHHTRNLPRVEALSRVDLGREYDRGEVLDALREARLESYEIFEDDDQLLQEVARRLARSEVVGWLHGRFEWGPRALGHRSILADPTNPETQGIVNEKIKFRERFRPFAPAVIAERAAEYFEFREPNSSAAPEHFMLAIGRVRSDKIAQIPAVTHVDGTARIQLVRRETNPRFYRLLEHFERLTGVPVLLNTSFNLRGEPMVASPADALKTFSWSDMDVVVLNDVLVNKEFAL